MHSRFSVAGFSFSPRICDDIRPSCGVGVGITANIAGPSRPSSRMRPKPTGIWIELLSAAAIVSVADNSSPISCASSGLIVICREAGFT